MNYILQLDDIKIKKGEFYKFIYTDDITFIARVNSPYLPTDEGEYLVPGKVIKDSGKSIKALLTYSAISQKVGSPIYVPDRKGILMDILKAGLITEDEEITLESIMALKDYDDDLAVLAEDLPKEIPWKDFKINNILPDIAFVFLLNDLAMVPLPEGIKLKCPLEDAQEDFMPLGFAPEFNLRKIQLKELPKIGWLYYLPAEITFNDLQIRRGYALYNVKEERILDLHIFDSEIGQISTNNNDKLEDCGIFKDAAKFKYKLLLSKS